MNGRRSAKPPLTTAQLALVARAALDNATSLLSDARVLLEAARWPRAYALAILSAEEYGKFQSCVVASSYDVSDDAAWKRFWKEFTSHSPKLTVWAGQFVDQIDWDEGYLDGNADWKRAWESRQDMVQRGTSGKLAALYVDVEQGQLRVPADLISEETACSTIDLVASVVAPAAELFAGDLTRLMTPSPAVSELWRRMKAADTAPPRDREAAAASAMAWFEQYLRQLDGELDRAGCDSEKQRVERDQ